MGRRRRKRERRRRKPKYTYMNTELIKTAGKKKDESSK